MDQSAGQELEFSGAEDSQRDSELGDTGGLRERPATGCASFASNAAPTTQGMTCEEPGVDQFRPESRKFSSLLNFLSLPLLQ